MIKTLGFCTQYECLIKMLHGFLLVMEHLIGRPTFFRRTMTALRKRGIIMADLDRKDMDQDLHKESQLFEEDYFGTGGYHEETSAELAEPLILNRRGIRDHDEVREGGKGVGMAALALSILSLFVFPILFGIAGIILGFVARKKGASSGTWAITIGAISLILGIFILPFF